MTDEERVLHDIIQNFARYERLQPEPACLGPLRDALAEAGEILAQGGAAHVTQTLDNLLRAHAQSILRRVRALVADEGRGTPTQLQQWYTIMSLFRDADVPLPAEWQDTATRVGLQWFWAVFGSFTRSAQKRMLHWLTQQNAKEEEKHKV